MRALRDVGCSVLILSGVGGGVPDLLVGKGGINWLMEVKIAKGDLNPDQVKFQATWRGSYLVVRSVGEALAAVGIRSLVAG